MTRISPRIRGLFEREKLPLEQFFTIFPAVLASSVHFHSISTHSAFSACQRLAVELPTSGNMSKNPFFATVEDTAFPTLPMNAAVHSAFIGSLPSFGEALGVENDVKTSSEAEFVVTPPPPPLRRQRSIRRDRKGMDCLPPAKNSQRDDIRLLLSSSTLS